MVKSVESTDIVTLTQEKLGKMSDMAQNLRLMTGFVQGEISKLNGAGYELSLVDGAPRHRYPLSTTRNAHMSDAKPNDFFRKLYMLSVGDQPALIIQFFVSCRKGGTYNTEVVFWRMDYDGDTSTFKTVPNVVADKSGLSQKAVQEIRKVIAEYVAAYALMEEKEPASLRAAAKKRYSERKKLGM